MLEAETGEPFDSLQQRPLFAGPGEYFVHLFRIHYACRYLVTLINRRLEVMKGRR